MRTLPGQELTDSDYAELRKLVDQVVWSVVFRPVVDLVRPALPREVRADLAAADLLHATPEELRNASEAEGVAALRKALQSGSVQRLRDPKRKKVLFAVAKPDRRVSDGLKSFGCRLNKTTGMWECEPSQVPAWVSAEASSYAAKAKALHDSMTKLLDDIEGKVDRAVDEAALARGVDHAVGEVARGWKQSAKELSVVPDLSGTGEAALRRAFESNARIPIKRMAKESVARLRAEVQENAVRGYRSTGLAERIRGEYGVSKERADLIARQETSNFMAAYRQARALDAGLKRYVWAIAGGVRTRPGHRELNNRVFRYDKKAPWPERNPAKYFSNGEPCNPGEDYRCRCMDRTVVE